MTSRDPNSNIQEENDPLITIEDVYRTLGRIIYTNHAKLTVDYINDSNRARGTLGSVMRALERRQRLDLVYVLLELYERLDHQLMKLQEGGIYWNQDHKTKLGTITSITKETQG